jgi:3-hydroxyisobutyrate dehydrogenase
VIGVCVVDDAVTEAVVAGDGGVLEGAAPGAIVAIHGTVHPATVRSLAERAAARGVHVVDAQITGGHQRAVERQLRYMVGGETEVLDRARPVFETSASQITYCGPVGMGAVAKLCNNLVQYQAWQAYVEAERLGRAAGLSQEVLLEVLAWIMNDNARTMMVGRGALERDPENAFLKGRFLSVMLLAEKDLSLALDVARGLGVSLPGTGLCAQQMARVFAIQDPKRR